MASNVITKFKVEGTEQYNQKVKGAKSTLEQFGMGGKQAGSMLGQFDKVLGTNIGTLGKLSVAVVAARGALEGLKRIIAGSQTTTDAFGRAQEACTRVVDGFFESISRGNFSSFILGLQDVITNARNAYDALDALSTFNAYNTKETAQFEKRRAQIRAQIRKGVDIEENKKLLQELEKQELTYYKTSAQRNRDAANASLISATGSKPGSGWLTPYNNMGEGGQAAAQKEADRLRAITESKEYRKAQQQGKIGTMSQMVGMDFTEVNKKIAALENYAQLSDEKLTEINGLYAKAEQAETQYWSKVASDSRLMNLKSNPQTGGGTGTGKGGGGSTIAQLSGKATGLDLNLIPDTSIKGVKEKLSEAQALYEEAGDEAGRKYAKAMIEAYSNELEYLKGNNPMMEQINKDFAESLKKSGITKELNDSGKAAKTTSRSVTGAASAFSSLGDAMSNIEDPGAKTAGLIANAIGSVVAGYGAATAQAAQMGPWAWIAFAVAGLATMVATVAQIKQVSAGAYAEGGVVGGNSYYGDKLYARVNSGETILNTQQQQRALAMMDGASMGGGTSTITGEQIVTVINAYGRRTGRGEILK